VEQVTPKDGQKVVVAKSTLDTSMTSEVSLQTHPTSLSTEPKQTGKTKFICNHILSNVFVLPRFIMWKM
jgi:hypothetical protein